MTQRNELISYAMDFVSYLLRRAGEVDRIILFGSAARNDYDEESDIDLFADTKGKIGKNIKKAVDDYYKTKRFREWDLKGINNKFSLIVGSLDSEEWKDLKRSIINTGIILYGKYKAEAENTRQYVLFSFENIKPDSKRVSIFRKLFGFKVGNKKYPGMVERIKAVRVGKGNMVVPAEYANELKGYFQSKKVAVKLIDLWSDAKLFS